MFPVFVRDVADRSRAGIQVGLWETLGVKGFACGSWERPRPIARGRVLRFVTDLSSRGTGLSRARTVGMQ